MIIKTFSLILVGFVITGLMSCGKKKTDDTTSTTSSLPSTISTSAK